MFGSVSSFFGKMFGTDKACESLVNNVSSGLDKLWYTAEEKAEDTRKRAEAGGQLLIDWLAATHGAHLTRRFLAVSLTLTWIAMLSYCVVLSAIAPFVCLFIDATDNITIPSAVEGKTIMVNKAVFLTQAVQTSVTTVGQYALGITGAMMLILGFYFAAPHLDKIVPSAMERFSNTFTKGGKKDVPDNGVK